MPLQFKIVEAFIKEDEYENFFENYRTLPQLFATGVLC